MEEFKKLLSSSGFSGDIDDSNEILDLYSHDASMFEIKPKLVISPKSASDVEKAVKLVAENKKTMPELSLTARSAGTDMSGAAINDSIIVDFKKYFTEIHWIKKRSSRLQPGVMFKDFDEQAKREMNVLMPTYPASRDLATVGGMVNNNSGGEKSIEFGKAEDFVNELEFVFADGVKRIVKPLKKPELVRKMAQQDFEGKVYREIFELIEKNYDLIKSAKPNVSKDSTGYHLWNVWDRETGIFDLNQIIVGAQGTLGFVTDIEFRMTEARSDEGLLVIFVKDIENLGDLIKDVVAAKPSRFESFDDNTMWLSIKFMPAFLKLLGLRKFIKLVFSLIPEVLLLFKGIPSLILMVSIKGNSPEETEANVHKLRLKLEENKKKYHISGFEEYSSNAKGEKFWIMRRYSFQILRSKVKDKHTAPFIDDFIVNPEHLPEFLPKIRKIIKKYKLFATIAGHMGDGNFHIIPLMDLEDKLDRAKILPAMKEVNELVLSYGGSLSGEHNDGLIRGPWLEKMYGKKMVKLFRDAKDIFDPEGIFNPRKKANADWDYSFSHIRKKF
ncbi:MAG TPA: FAD-binding oxidoreductase [Candidatus Saccharibacteria bacterium]|nr:FAD-binding oxidoreductase [Candidatus Saccharibacteria bacterium]HRQ97763.1 FAD-binding oxidoreductase [Candidatus Saccharibacteria bacterium]